MQPGVVRVPVILASALLALASCVLASCAAPRPGVPRSAVPSARIIRPSIKRVRFFNETSYPTQEVTMGGPHVTVWHSTAATMPSPEIGNLIDTYDEPIDAGDDGSLGEGPNKGPSSMAVMWRFKINGLTVTDWMLVPVVAPGNKILEMDITVLDGASSSLIVMSQAYYYDDVVGRSQWGPMQVRHFSP